MPDKTADMTRRDRHALAIETLLARDTIEMSSRQFLSLLTHLQANVLFQRRMTSAIASVAAGEAEWDGIEKVAEIAEFSGDALDRFIFDVAERNSNHE